MVHFLTAEEALIWLKKQGRKQDRELDLFECALAIAVQNHDGISLDSYRQHMRKLSTDLEDTHIQLTQNQGSSLEKQVQTLQMVFSQKHGYTGDTRLYDNLDNADIIRVIDRRLGLPITLALLCIQMGRDVGWDIQGLNFPGHFLIRLDFEGARAIIDPFESCRSLQAADLRGILKHTLGEGAELSNHYYDATSNRDILIRLHNNVKLRLIEAEEFQAALDTVEVIRHLVPDENRLNLDAGILQARLEQPMAAITSLQTYMNLCADPAEKAQTQELILQIRGQIN